MTGASSLSLLGTNHTQLFAGPFADYTWNLTHQIGLEARASYLFGNQPLADMSGGNALLAVTGIRASFGSRRLNFYGRIAPGLVSFSNAGGPFNAAGYQTTSRLTHFALDEGGGVELRLAEKTALRFDASHILFVEGGESGGTTGALTWVLPGYIEDHLALTAGAVRYFGKAKEDSAGADVYGSPKNELTISFALQPQQHLAFPGSISPDTGFAVSASRNMKPWLGLDASAIVLPGGDAPNYQDGGTETELMMGPRAGLQRARYALLGKYRFGVASFASTINQNSVSPPPVRTWNYATDAGAIFELNLSRHSLLRLDAGEQYTQFHSVQVKEPPPVNSATQAATRTHSPLVLVGFGWRF